MDMDLVDPSKLLVPDRWVSGDNTTRSNHYRGAVKCSVQTQAEAIAYIINTARVTQHKRERRRRLLAAVTNIQENFPALMSGEGAKTNVYNLTRTS